MINKKISNSRKIFITFALILMVAVSLIMVLAVDADAEVIIGAVQNNFDEENKNSSQVESKELKIEDKENVEIETAKPESKIADVNVENETIVVNKHIVNIDKKEESLNNNEIKNEIIDDIVSSSKDENNKFVRFEKNKDVIQKLKADVFTLLPTEWLFSGKSIIIDPSPFNENKDYFLYENLDKSYISSITSGNIIIYAVDEIWNNGQDYVLQTRCYIDVQ